MGIRVVRRHPTIGTVAGGAVGPERDRENVAGAGATEITTGGRVGRVQGHVREPEDTNHDLESVPATKRKRRRKRKSARRGGCRPSKRRI